MFRVAHEPHVSIADRLLRALLEAPVRADQFVGYMPEHVRVLRDQLRGTGWRIVSAWKNIPTRYGMTRQKVYTLRRPRRRRR